MFFIYFHHLSARYFIDIVRRTFVFVTNESKIVKSTVKDWEPGLMQELNSLFVTRHGVLIRELSFYPKPPNKTLDITTNNSGEYH